MQYILRKFKPFSWARKSTFVNKKKIVVLGTGWSSYSFLKYINRDTYDVKVVSPRNHFLFTPLLCSTTVGTIEFRSITEPIRNIGFKAPDDFLLAQAEEIDINKKVLTCQNSELNLKFQLPYDILIIGVGCLNNTFGIPGADKYTYFLKEISHAQKIRYKILRNCERALAPSVPVEEKEHLLHTVIVGGGPTGIEFGAELYDFKAEDVKRLYTHIQHKFKVTLIEADNILRSFDHKLRKYAEKKLKERPNFTLLKSSVVEVQENCVVLKDGTKIPCGLVVWSAGLKSREFTKNLAVSKNKSGQILTDNFLRVLGDSSGSLYAIGDCAEIETVPLPLTAQVAEREGRYLAKSLNDLIRGAEIKPFHFKSKGMLTYIGGYKALTDLPNIKVQGFISWFLWRSAYLTRLGSWRLRMQVPIDWLKTLLFGRDTSYFS